jgi:endonuclease/exonuclease/phosphatase family metal-dependent hydrolase
MLRRALAAFAPLLSMALAGFGANGCAVQSGEADELAADEAEIAYGDRGAVQIYNANLKHLSQPGRPSFEGTDFTRLLHWMARQETLPDILTLQEVGTREGDKRSQSCDAFVDALERIVRPDGWKTGWKCIVANGSTSSLDNAQGGVAIVHRGRFDPIGRKETLPLYRWSDGECRRANEGTGWTALVQKFDDGKHTIAVASVHLPLAGRGANATGDDCAARNLDLVEAALAATKADAKVIAGDMNHGDATRRVSTDGTVVHEHWEVAYRDRNRALSGSRYHDPFFEACNGDSRCLETDHWTMNNEGEIDARIDWVLVAGARTENAKTIGFEEVDPTMRYSDHRAHAVRVRY